MDAGALTGRGWLRAGPQGERGGGGTGVAEACRGEPPPPPVSGRRRLGT